MIPVAELPEVSATVLPRDVIDVDNWEELSVEELGQVYDVDCDLDQAAQAAAEAGQLMFEARLPVESHSARVMAGIKEKWEKGGWIVAAFRDGESLRFVFVRPPPGMQAKEMLPPRPVARGAPMKGNSVGARAGKTPRTSTPLLLRMPTRGRPAQVLRVLGEYRARALGPVAIEVVIDADDESMIEPRVLQHLYDLDCTVTVGQHRNKIEACNGGRLDDWDILVLGSDDMVPVVDGWDRRIVEEMDRHFPLRDGALNFSDGYNNRHTRAGLPVLNTLPIYGRHLYEQFGYVYPPSYASVYCDDHMTRLLSGMNRLVYIDEVIIEHRHPAAGKAAPDALYQHNDSSYARGDREVFEALMEMKRPGSQFGFDAPPLWLSILVCSLASRGDKLRRLVDHLRAQMRHFPREVELRVDVDEGQATVGQKRQRLLQTAVGKYVCFIDDDDMVSHDYVSQVLQACWQDKDCVSLRGRLLVGEREEPFEHSRTYDHWYTRADGMHVRTPNHLNAVRRELALKVGFLSQNVGEDRDFSDRLRPLLQSEAHPSGGKPLYYYFAAQADSVQRSAT